ncbi:CCA tRNA nucleotidyltransferase [Hungatella hathewayi]|uniref:CCA tRNA nucleotidyltransferase n=1 Tax=Hungatella hathewayi TaxID=154046 RepID=UPI00210A3B0D|nr:CCA tRNA nucleotidyltransferase [Hungatella hathewayi]MCQ5385789.1 CCA tRNA nucleotidyltransferase [Hungatella hathewayi]
MVKEIRVPADAEQIIEKLNEHGFEAYVVGGCVRDSLLGKEPEDWDITTSARPGEVKSIFSRTIDTGIQHGTVTVMLNRQGYEVTTYRVDGEYEDGRHPKSVDFTTSLLEDLKRRDFTINAMAYNSREGLVDAFGGIEDLENRVIRCVGSAVNRFTEDALRILRAVRFSAQLDFRIEDETYEAISIIAPNLEKVSKERIATELTKLLLSSHPEKMKRVSDTGASRYVSEPFCRAAALNKDELRPLGLLPAVKYMRWAGLLRREQGETAAAILRDLKMDCDTMDKVKILVSRWRIPISAEKPAIRRVMNQIPPDLLDSLLCFQEVFAAELGEGYRETLKAVKTLAEEIRRDGDPVNLKELAVDGRDLMAAGMKPGPALGKTLNALMEQVLERPECNTREYLLNAAGLKCELP